MGHQENLTFYGFPIKYLSLLTLVVQNSSYVLLLRYSRIRPGTKYLTSTAVVTSELTKLIICTTIHLYQRRQEFSETSSSLPLTSDNAKVESGVVHGTSRFFKEVFSINSGFFGICIPAFLYTLQNNLQIIAASHLDAATFQVSYQGKILTTALLSVVLLRTKLSRRKWLSLLYLTIGVAAVQISPSGSSSNSSASQGSWAIGMSSVVAACFLSGLAGVSFELILKRTATSLWIRNIQLSAASLAIALFGSLVYDKAAIREQGFFQGYDLVVVSTILMQAAGGLVVAVVVKYADNILKGFATSLSTIVSTVASVYFFEFVVSAYFLEGAALVFVATYIYGLPDASVERFARESSTMSTTTESDLETAKVTVEEYLDGRSSDGDDRSLLQRDMELIEKT